MIASFRKHGIEFTHYLVEKVDAHEHSAIAIVRVDGVRKRKRVRAVAIIEETSPIQ
jgi:hypothetical protein